MDITNIKEVNLNNIKRRTYEILDVPTPDDQVSRLFDIFMRELISLNVLATMLQTVKPLYNLVPSFFSGFEIISVAIFTFEYILRIWSCTILPGYSDPFSGRLRFSFFKPLMIIDCMAILPFYLPFLGIDLRFIRIFRLFRIFRIVKFARYSQALRIFGKVFVKKKEELIISMSFLVLLLIIGSFLIYDEESRFNPRTFDNVFETLLWSFNTLTNTGNGEIILKTQIGKFVASITSFMGILFFALPASILTSGFIEEYYYDKERIKCPYCNKTIKNMDF